MVGAKYLHDFDGAFNDGYELAPPSGTYRTVQWLVVGWCATAWLSGSWLMGKFICKSVAGLAVNVIAWLH